MSVTNEPRAADVEIVKTEAAIHHESSHVENLDEKLYEKQQRRQREDDASSIRSEALGDNLPQGYFYSVRFIGSLVVSITAEQILLIWRAVPDKVVGRASVCRQFQLISSC